MSYPCSSAGSTRRKNGTKQFTVFINGNEFYHQKVIINPSKTRKWHHILNEISNKINPNFGIVKKLYSSDSGVTLKSFTELENGGTYVASDNRKFQILENGYCSERGEHFFEHYLTGQLDRKNKQRKLSYVRRDLLVIYVFNNGQDKDPPTKFVLSKDDLNNWEYTLSFIALTLDMPHRDLKCLCNSKGIPICGPWELQHGATYVAVGFFEKFKQRPYKIQEDTTQIWRVGSPAIPKNKNAPCPHVNNAKIFKRNMKWKQCLTECYEELLQDELIKQLDNLTNKYRSLRCNCKSSSRKFPSTRVKVRISRHSSLGSKNSETKSVNSLKVDQKGPKQTKNTENKTKYCAKCGCPVSKKS